MGSASTALSQIINQQVNITTPVVTITTLEELRKPPSAESCFRS